MSESTKIFQLSKKIIVAGPCSAESEEQLISTAKQLEKLNVDAFRFGIWKPRTRPDSFEGVGEIGLEWMKILKSETNLPLSTEVASASHVEKALKSGIDVLWIGARTTVNPFMVQEIADALNGVSNVSLMIKNPVNPELALWIGAIERILKSGITDLAAIHRGFSSYGTRKYRNPPKWKIPISFKQEFPNIPLLCDPSHITGDVNLVPQISQKAYDLDFDGLMVEVHPNPSVALSDKEQQIPLNEFEGFLNNLKLRKHCENDTVLEELRDRIDDLDKDLVELIDSRFEVINQIANYKKDKNITVFQKERWKEIVDTRPEWSKNEDLKKTFITEIYRMIHEESLKIQSDIFNSKND